MFGRKGPASEGLERFELEAYVPELDFPAPLAEEVPPWPVSVVKPEEVKVEHPTDGVDTAVRVGIAVGALTGIVIESVQFINGTISQSAYHAAGFSTIGTYVLADISFITYRSRHPKTKSKNQ